VASVECARSIQQAFEAFNLASKEKLRVRIGIDVGEPIADSNDLFGATVQMAARLCQLAQPRERGLRTLVLLRSLLSLPSNQCRKERLR